MKWWHFRWFTIAAAVLLGMALRDVVSWWRVTHVGHAWCAAGVFPLAAAGIAAGLGLYRGATWARWLGLGLLAARVVWAAWMFARFDPPPFVTGIAAVSLVALACLLDRRPRPIDVAILCAGLSIPAIAAHVHGWGPSPLEVALFRVALALVLTGIVGLCLERMWGLFAIAAAAAAMAIASSIELAAALGFSTADCLGARFHLMLPDFQAAAAATVILTVGVWALARPLLRSSRARHAATHEHLQRTT